MKIKAKSILMIYYSEQIPGEKTSRANTRLEVLPVKHYLFITDKTNKNIYLVGATDTVATVMEKVFCGYPLDEGTVSLGDGYATNLEILMGCVLQWVVFFAVYRTKYKQWPSFIFSKVKDKEGHFVIK